MQRSQVQGTVEENIQQLQHLVATTVPVRKKRFFRTGRLDHEVFAMIRKLVEDKRRAPPPYKVPVGWFLLEQDITKSAKGGVISRKECLAIASILDIDKEALNAALEYFDSLNIFLYYPSVLPEVVFSSPQLLPDKVTEFVHFSYSLQSDSPPVALEGMWLQFKEKGIVIVDMFQDERFSAHYIPDLFKPTMQSTPCTLELLRGHSLYTRVTEWTLLVC